MRVCLDPCCLAFIHTMPQPYVICFASLCSTFPSIHAHLCRDLYRLKSMNADTRVYGVVGNPVSQSKSPAIHNPAFAKEGVNAVYLPFLVDDFGAFLQAYSDPHFAGEWWQVASKLQPAMRHSGPM